MATNSRTTTITITYVLALPLVDSSKESEWKIMNGKIVKMYKWMKMLTSDHLNRSSGGWNTKLDPELGSRYLGHRNFHVITTDGAEGKF